MCSWHDLVPASVIVNASGHNDICSRSTNPARVGHGRQRL